MEESKLSVQIHGVEETDIGDDFYENLEAPKFVDLNAPDRYHPGDDSYWFCLRVGCDQKHEEEMDSEEIYKNFVLRVMAARSPNIRLHKALYKRNSSSTNKKCPQTVPAKPSKSRVTRMALISSISKRLVDPKVKVKPKKSETPKSKATKQSSVVAKARTTPGNKKQLSNPDGFQSVRNPEATAIAVPKTRAIAKTLVFHSPKKAVRAKTSSELDTPLKSLCAGMKRLEITDGKKHVLGYNRQHPSDIPRKQPRGREVKSRVYDGLCLEKHKVQEVKSSKRLKEKKKEKNLQQDHGSVLCEGNENAFIKMEIDDSMNGPMILHSSSNGDHDEGNGDEGALASAKVSKPSRDENEVEDLSHACASDLNSISNFEERSSGDSVVPEFQVPTAESSNANGKDQEDPMKPNLDKVVHVVKIDDNHSLTSDDKENDCEAVESECKENASTSDDNRELDHNNIDTKSKIHGKHEISNGTPKRQINATAMRKPAKERSITAVMGADGLKHRKLKPTNPKPFRLRTDERRILKETNLEKKHYAVPLKEITSLPEVSGENVKKKEQNSVQSNDKCLEQAEHNTYLHEDTEKKNRMQQDNTRNKSSSSNVSKERMGRRSTATIPQRHTVSSQKKLVTPKQKWSHNKAAQKLGNSSRRTKSLSVRQVARNQEESFSAKEAISVTPPNQLSTINETSTTILRSTEAANRNEKGAYTMAKASACASKLSQLEKRCRKIPRNRTSVLPFTCQRNAQGK